MKRLLLIRHGKSSWSEAGVDDFHRDLNHRGKNDAEAMGKRLAVAGIKADLIVASPAVRTKKTALLMAAATGYDENAIQYDKKLYLGDLSYHCRLMATLFLQVDVLFLVGHNDTITVLAEHLCGHDLGNVPTCGIVALEYSGAAGFTTSAGQGKLTFFWYPKDKGAVG